MKWVLVLRDTTLFLLGAALLVKALLDRNPDPVTLEVAAGLTGIPAWLHARAISNTGSTPEPSQAPPSSEPPSLPSATVSGGEQ